MCASRSAAVEGQVNFAKLIASCRSRKEAQAYKAFVPTKDDVGRLGEIGREVLQHLPPEAGACALMSAVYAARLQSVGLAPAYVAAGSLLVQGQRVFGDGRPFDGAKAFSESNSDWDGHAWVMFGPYVADVSIFRTAYSSQAPRLLAAHVRQEFGNGRGLLVVRWSDAPKSGLHYLSQYVLTESQVSGLVRGASARFSSPS